MCRGIRPARQHMKGGTKGTRPSARRADECSRVNGTGWSSGWGGNTFARGAISAGSLSALWRGAQPGCVQCRDAVTGDAGSRVSWPDLRPAGNACGHFAVSLEGVPTPRWVCIHRLTFVSPEPGCVCRSVSACCCGLHAEVHRLRRGSFDAQQDAACHGSGANHSRIQARA